MVSWEPCSHSGPPPDEPVGSPRVAIPPLRPQPSREYLQRRTCSFVANATGNKVTPKDIQRDARELEPLLPKSHSARSVQACAPLPGKVHVQEHADPEPLLPHKQATAPTAMQQRPPVLKRLSVPSGRAQKCETPPSTESVQAWLPYDPERQGRFAHTPENSRTQEGPTRRKAASLSRMRRRRINLRFIDKLGETENLGRLRKAQHEDVTETNVADVWGKHSLFHDANSAHFWWSTLMVLVSVYSVLWDPFFLAFYEEHPYMLVDHLVTACFFVDILVSFNTAVRNPQTGSYIIDRHKICYAYVFSLRFWTDVISAAPVAALVALFTPQLARDEELGTAVGRFLIAGHATSSSVAAAGFAAADLGVREEAAGNVQAVSRGSRLWRLLRLFRMMRLFQTRGRRYFHLLEEKLLAWTEAAPCMKRVNLTELIFWFMHGSVGGLLGTVTVLLYSAHLVSCLWYLTALEAKSAGYERTWMDVALEGMDPAWRDEQSGWYWISFYWSLNALVLSLSTPCNPYELKVNLVLLVFAALVFSFILSNVAEIVKKWYAEEVKLHEKLDGIREFCAANNISGELASKLSKFYEPYYQRKSDTLSREEILEPLTDHLQDEVIRHLFEESVARISLFTQINMGGDDDCRNDLFVKVWRRLRLTIFGAKEEVLDTRDPNEELYFLFKGKIQARYLDLRLESLPKDLHAPLKAHEKHAFEIKDIGDVFGEHAVIKCAHAPSSLIYESSTHLELLYLDVDDLVEIFDELIAEEEEEDEDDGADGESAGLHSRAARDQFCCLLLEKAREKLGKLRNWLIEKEKLANSQSNVGRAATRFARASTQSLKVEERNTQLETLIIDIQGTTMGLAKKMMIHQEELNGLKLQQLSPADTRAARQKLKGLVHEDLFAFDEDPQLICVQDQAHGRELCAQPASLLSNTAQKSLDATMGSRWSSKKSIQLDGDSRAPHSTPMSLDKATGSRWGSNRSLHASHDNQPPLADEVEALRMKMERMQANMEQKMEDVKADIVHEMKALLHPLKRAATRGCSSSDHLAGPQATLTRDRLADRTDSVRSNSPSEESSSPRQANQTFPARKAASMRGALVGAISVSARARRGAARRFT